LRQEHKKLSQSRKLGKLRVERAQLSRGNENKKHRKQKLKRKAAKGVTWSSSEKPESYKLQRAKEARAKEPEPRARARVESFKSQGEMVF